MKKLLLFLLASIFVLPTKAQTIGWIRHFSPIATLHSVQVLPNGYAYLADDGIEILYFQLGLDGAPTGTINLGTIPDDIVPSSDGGFFKGYMDNTNIRLQKLDASGTLLWEQWLLDTIPPLYLRLSALPDGGCYTASARRNTTSPGHPFTLVNRFAANGTALWQYPDFLNGWDASAQRRINDVVTLPDSSCAILTSDQMDTYHGAGHLSQIKPDGTAGYSTGHSFTWSFVNGGEFHIARPMPDGSLLALGHIWSGSGGFHPSSSSTGFSLRLAASNGVIKVQEVHYPPTLSQILTTYGTDPLVAAPMPNGDMISIEQHGQEIRLRRISWDLKDSSWERPLTTAGGFLTWRIRHPNRLIYSTPDGGAIIGGVDYDGIFLMKIGPWGDDSTVAHLPMTGQVLEDLDFDCQTIGPYMPVTNARVRFSSLENPAHRWWATTDTAGRVEVVAPPGFWQVEVADSLDAIYGKSCVQDTLLLLSDTLPVPMIQLPVLRYKARLSGRAGFDNNSNCLFDAGTWGIYGQRVKLVHGTNTSFVATDQQGRFSVSVDTGQYHFQIEGYNPGVFNGYYCKPTLAYLPSHQSSDSVTLIWGYLRDCKARVQVRRDTDYNCSPPMGDTDWGNMLVIMKDVATGYGSVGQANNNGIIEHGIVGPGDLQVSFTTSFEDSLICSTGLPHTLHFTAGDSGQYHIDTLVGFSPRLVDTLKVCPGTWLYNQLITKDTIIQTTVYFLSGYLPVKAMHHVLVLTSPVTHLYVIDTTINTDSIQTFVFTATNGCDSTVYVHFLSSSIKDLAGVPRLRLSPNPTTGMVRMHFLEMDVTCIVTTDMTGKVVKKIEHAIGSPNGTFSLEGLPAGTYIIRAFRQNGTCLVGKILLE